jgi:hypothetical protein
MPTLKLIFNDALEYDFKLIAIHCSLEDYRIAYFLNKHLGIQLQRRTKDVDFTKEGHEALFSLFTFEDSKNYRSYTLVGNRCKVEHPGLEDNASLFTTQESFKLINLIPELKKTDFFLKLESDTPTPKTMLAKINQIPQVITAYTVDVNKLKSKRNLIFE